MSGNGPWSFTPQPTWRDRLRERWNRLLGRGPWRGWQEIGYTTNDDEESR